MAQRSIISFLTHEAPTSPDGGAATLAQALDARVREGELIEKLSDHAVRCFACGHRCLVKPGRRGICKVRFNKDGTLYVPAGYVAALQCDPTEKKPFFHALLDRLLQDRLQSDGRSPLPRVGRRLAARARCDPHGVRAGILARARDPRRPGVQRRRRAAAPGRRLYRVGEPRNPVARDRIPQGLPHDRPRQHVGGNAAAGVRDRGGGRPQVRVCGQSSGPGRALGAYVVPRLRRVADRAPWICDSATADRRRGRLRRLRPADPGRVVVGLLLVALQGAGVFDTLVEDGIRRGAYPGAALIVGRRDTILFAKGYGHLTWSAASPAVDPDSTMYDLASLTKVVATTTSLMLLVEPGQVRLDEPVSTYIAELKGRPTAGITIRQLLTHTSGFRDVRRDGLEIGRAHV